MERCEALPVVRVERSGTVDKAVRVLEALRLRGSALSLAELAPAVGLPKPTLHRLLASLASYELVEQAGDGRYGLGIGLVRLGLSAQAAEPMVRVARAELERAMLAFGETFFLVTARGGRLFVIDKVESTGVLRAAPSVGAEVAVETTASGRLYLGLRPDALSPRPPATSALCEAVERARSRGYDTNEGEWIAGLTVVAAPVFGHAGLAGTVACAGGAQQLTGERLAAAIAYTRQVAERTTQALTGAREEQP
jgi:DNA-binding IclR family transcriptional regulator